MTMRGQCRRVRTARGSTLAETALVLVPLLALFMGIVDFSFAIFLRSTLQHAVREGVRYAVTYQTGAGMGHDASIREVVRQNTMGFLPADEVAEKVVIRYYNPATLAETATNDPGNIIEVSIEGFQFGWLCPILRDATPLTMMARSSDRMEGLPGGAAPPAR